MTDTLMELLGMIQTIYGIDPGSIDPLQSLSQFGMDSLGLAELMFNIEDHFNIEYPESRTHVDSLAELAEVVTELRVAAVAH